MRLKLLFQLENNILDVQYRKGIISWIKKAIQEYEEEFYNEIYNLNNKKTFCFAPILSSPKFSKEFVVMDNGAFSVIFSSYNYVHSIKIYNAFLNQKFKKFSLNKNSMTLINIVMMSEKEIITSSIKIKMSSPIISRNHNRETLKDMYYSFKHEEFYDFIKINIVEQLETEGLDSSLMDTFSIKPINARKTVVPLYEKMIECSIGTFELQGKVKLLDYLYKAGIGSKKAMGFGLFEVM